MIKVQIVGANGKILQIGEEGSIDVSVHTHPPLNEEIESLPFRQYFTDNGSSTGSSDMAINGSTTPTEFYIKASKDYDIYIKYVSVEIGDGGSPNLNSFGALSALTTGVQFFWDTQQEPYYVLHEGIKTNKEFIRIGTDTAAIGTGADAFLADVSGGGSEKSYFPAMDIKELYGLPWGLRLRKGTLDRLLFKINDNLTGLSTFNAIATGIRI